MREKGCIYKKGNHFHAWALSQCMCVGLYKLNHLFSKPRPRALAELSYAQRRVNGLGMKAMEQRLSTKKGGEIFQFGRKGAMPTPLFVNLSPDP